MTALVVVRTGPLALIQDLGRAGHAHLGVPPSGAVDAPALLRANAIVGNRADAAGVECVLGGLVLRAAGSCTLAVTGAPCDVRGGAFDSAFTLADGDEVRLGTPARGLRCYLTVRGGVDVAADLGSRSTDVLTGIGPAPLAVGDELPIGSLTGSCPVPPVVDLDAVPVILGPRDSWFPDARGQLARGEWTVSPSSNRVGVRLSGTALRRSRGGELPTEAVITGSVQVPPSGEPVIFLTDHPTTGGYPVIGVVPPAGLPLLAQARPGSRISLRPR